MADEILFYIGIAGIICSILMAAVYFLMSRMKKNRLDIQLDKEYGKE